MKISVVGLGYVGLANAIALAQNNHIYAHDINRDRVRMLNKGKSPITDSMIDDYLKKPLSITFTTDFRKAIKGSDYIIIATPTNYNPENQYFDTSSIDETAEKALKINPIATIIIKSTIPIDYTESLRKKLHTDRIVFSPEFLREGRALEDVLNPTRIIIGDKSKTGEKIADLFQRATTTSDAPVLLTNSSEAEAIKLFANTYLANRVAFFNELDSYAISKNLNTADIISGICLDNRIGEYYNNPSFGYGGYCLPKDTKQLLSEYTGIPNSLIAAIVKSNIKRKQFIAEQIIAKNPNTVGVFRLIMKSGSENFRESSIIDIIDILIEKGIRVILYEPLIQEQIFHGAEVNNNLEKFKMIADIIITNRNSNKLDDVIGKVYTRDIYGNG